MKGLDNDFASRGQAAFVASDYLRTYREFTQKIVITGPITEVLMAFGYDWPDHKMW